MSISVSGRNPFLFSIFLICITRSGFLHLPEHDMSTTNFDILQKLYYDPSQGLWSLQKIRDKLKSQNIRIPVNDIKQFLKNQEVLQLFKQRHVKHHFPLRSDTPFQRIQIDLLDVSNEHVIKNRGCKFIFVCIDAYTRYVIAVPIKNKSEEQCVSAFQSILDQIGQVSEEYGLPTQVDSDNESSFMSHSFKQLCDENEMMQHFSQPGDYKSKGIVERFNRTLRLLIQKYMAAHHTDTYIDVLPNLIDNYNHTIHRTLKKSPLDAIQDNERYITDRDKQMEKAKREPYNRDSIAVGDRVRLLIKKGIFEKGTTHRWTKHIHTVESTDGVEYNVSGRQLVYRKAELLKVDHSEQAPIDVDNVPIVVVQPAVDEEKQQVQRARRQQRIMNQEGVSDTNVRVGLRERRPRVGIVNERGEEILF